jgi:prophage DNA circulation protein
MSLFSGNLLPASFRGVPFAVVDTAVQVGRRVALHQYPARDDPWAEDMGRAARQIRLRGFIVENDPVYLGGPIQLQRLALLAATEAAGPGTLTHPTLGLLTVMCEGASLGEAIDGATYSTVEFSFIEAGKQTLPSLFVSSLGVSPEIIQAVTLAADAVRLVALAGTALSGNADGSLPSTTTAWSGQITALGNDATALSRLAAALPGNLGRYSRGATSGFLTSIDTTAADSLPQLVTLAAAQRAAIASAASDLDTVVAALSITTDEGDYTAAAAALVAALSNACADPADALRLLTQLLSFSPAGQTAGTPSALAVSTLFARLTVLEMVRAAAAYQPASYEDAFAQLVAVTAALDDAIEVAGDTGEDDLFAALRSLRVRVVNDLRARGATLEHVRTFVVDKPLPALVLAQRFYRDADRADELVGEAAAGCISPLFMPTSIQALAA